MFEVRNFIIVDNRDITRAGLISYIKEMNPNLNIVEVMGYNSLLEELRIQPLSVVVVDYSLFDFSSLNHMLNIKSGAKESLWLLFSEEPGEQFLRQLLISDSSISIVLKNGVKEEIINALTVVTKGGVYLCDYAESVMKSEQYKNDDRKFVKLTASEKNILHEIAMGKTTKQIAVEKHLSFHTINTHRRNIYTKLGVNSVNEATRYALQAGLIDLVEYYI